MTRINAPKISALLTALVVSLAPLASAPALGQGVRESAPQASVVPGSAPGRAAAPPERAPQDVEPARVGSFWVYPELSITQFFDSNVYYASRDDVDDFANVVSPALYVDSGWQRHSLSLKLGADLTRYHRHVSEDSNDWFSSLEGRVDISHATNVFGGVRYSRDHEDRESPSDRNGLDPTRYSNARGYVGAFHQIGRVGIRLGGTVQHLDYSDVLFLNSSGVIRIINSDDRDRTQHTAGVRLTYEATPWVVPFFQGAADLRDYRNIPDDLGFNRNSEGTRYLLGLRFARPGTLKNEIFAGRIHQDFDDHRLVDVTAPAYGGSAIWSATDDIRITAYLDRTLEETTVFDSFGPSVLAASSYLNSYASLWYDQHLSSRWSFNFGATFSRVDYQGIVRVDDYWGGGAGIAFRLRDALLTELNVRYRELRTESPDENFSKLQVFLKLSIALLP